MTVLQASRYSSIWKHQFVSNFTYILVFVYVNIPTGVPYTYNLNTLVFCYIIFIFQ